MKFSVFSRFLLASLILLLAGCNHKEFCYKHPHSARVKVVFDWRDAPDANPDGMCVFFYPEDGGEYRRYDFNNTTGGEIELTLGRYRIICYNNDTETVYFTGMSRYDTHSILSPESGMFEPLGYSSSFVPRASEDERIVRVPEMMWGCHATEVELTPDQVKYLSAPVYNVAPEDDRAHTLTISRDLEIVLYPHELVSRYTLEVRNVENLSHATQMCASLTGMSGMIKMDLETLDNESVTLPYACYKYNETTLRGNFYTFGHSLQNPDPPYVVLYVWMDDGKIYCYGLGENRFDLTEQVHTAPDPRNVFLVIDGLGLPRPISNGSGFGPSVDDWQEEHHDLEM